ncbi:MAG: hypothetical protein JWQ73_3985 [Variovorax sp.]|nr:hypothetical protein [Variovorax sp.]
MHSAPSVSYPVGRSRDAALLLGSLWAAGACCAGAALFQVDRLGWRQALLMTSVVLTAMAARRTLGPTLVADLVFDGQDWSLSGGAPRKVARIAVLLDLQFLMLVRLDEPAQRPRWLWLERRSHPGRWQDLRRAVYSRVLPASTAVAAP